MDIAIRDIESKIKSAGSSSRNFNRFDDFDLDDFDNLCHEDNGYDDYMENLFDTYDLSD